MKLNILVCRRTEQSPVYRRRYQYNLGVVPPSRFDGIILISGGKVSELYFTSAPDQREAYKVGDRVDVLCDHENEKGERVRDWLSGTVVQVDPKMIAIQFQENVYLTDGWMVPDHVLWCPKISSNLRPAQTRRRRTRPRAK
jgi:hypothetical protein